MPRDCFPPGTPHMTENRHAHTDEDTRAVLLLIAAMTTELAATWRAPAPSARHAFLFSKTKNSLAVLSRTGKEGKSPRDILRGSLLLHGAMKERNGVSCLLYRLYRPYTLNELWRYGVSLLLYRPHHPHTMDEF